MPVAADIVNITCPASAAPGETVSICMEIKNVYSAPVTIRWAVFHSSQAYGEYIIFYDATLAAGQSFIKCGEFVMPSNPITVYAYAYYYGSDYGWHLDDQETKNVSLKVVNYDFTIGQPVASAA